MVAEEASRAGEGRRAEARVLRRAAEVTDPMLAELRSLTPPRGDEARVSEYLAAVARTGPAYAALADAAESGSRARIRAASREARETTLAASRLAQAYGFKGCGS